MDASSCGAALAGTGQADPCAADPGTASIHSLSAVVGCSSHYMSRKKKQKQKQVY